jgi:acyl-CoA synthetase (AMP-forming)/AMP-acid ligase II
VTTDDVNALKAAAPTAELHILYGSTEVEPIAHLVATEMPPGSEDAEGVCVGRLAHGLDAKLLRLERGPVALGSRGWAECEASAGGFGELVVAGDHVCRDYYRSPEAFRAAKIIDAAGRVWHRTGDVCRFDAEGRLWVGGRVHNAISRAGETLLPVRPEFLMKRLPFVADAAYLGLPDAELGERAAAAFSLKPGAAPADPVDDVRRSLAAAGVVCDEVVEVKAIPLDPRHHSKVEYARLREQILAERQLSPGSPAAGHEFAPPPPETEDRPRTT